MLFGGAAQALICSHEFGEQSGLTMLPPLGTPFRARDLDAKLEALPADPDRRRRFPSMSTDRSAMDGSSSGTSPRSIRSRWSRAVPEALVCVRHPT